jgi:plasmid segregation protein ParM
MGTIMSKKNSIQENELNPIVKIIQEKGYSEIFSSIVGSPVENFGSENFTVGAVDVGYGNTKYLAVSDGDVGFKHGHFPSLAPIAPNVDMSGGMLGKRNTKIIELDTVRYEVGPDTEMTSVGSDTSRILNDQYIFSQQYKALFLGALAYMGKESFDIVVMGLPVKNMYNAEKLEKEFTGIFEIDDGKKVEIKKVVVIPQPLGGFYDIAIREDMYEQMVDEINLVIDPGYLTFDFLVLNGLTPIENRSDAMNGGMSKVLISMAKSISSSIGRQYTDYNAIDKALRKPKMVKDSETGEKVLKRVIKIAGKQYDLLPHIKKTSPVIENSITSMQNVVQTFDDIDNIMLVGGPEGIFERKIIEAIKVDADEERDLLKSKEPIYSNVTGFFFWGVIYMLKELSK